MPRLGFGIEKQDFETAQTLIRASADYDWNPTADNWQHYRNCWNLAVARVRDTSRSATPMPATRALLKLASGAENPYKIGWLTDTFGTWHKGYASAMACQDPARLLQAQGPRKGL